MQLPWLQPQASPIAEGLGGIGDSLVQAARNKQDRDKQAADLLMRGREMALKEREVSDAEARATRTEKDQKLKAAGDEHLKISQLWKQDPKLAASYINATGGQASVEPVYDQGSAPLGAPGGPGATPDQVDAVSGPPTQPAMPPTAPAAPMAVQPPPFSADPGGSGAPVAPQPPSPTEQLTQQLVSHPQQVAAHADAIDQMKQQRAAVQQGPLLGHRLRYKLDPNAQETVLDPTDRKAVQDAEEQDRIKKLDAAGLPAKYKMILSARLGQGEDPKAAWEGISNLMRADDERSFKAGQAETYQTTAKQKFQIGMANAAAHQQSAAASAGSKDDAAAARAQGLLERAGNDVDKLVNWKDLQTMDNKTRLALGELATNHALPERDAKVLAASIFRGGVPTSGEMHELYSNLGGTMDAWNRFKSNAISGRLDDLQREQLKSSLETAANVVQERKMRALKTIKARLGPGSGYETMGPQVNRVIQARAVQAGVDDFPDLYDESAGPGAVLMGSKRKPAQTVEAAKSNPLVTAAKLGKLPAHDQDLAKQAMDRIAKNPNDAVAAAWLQHHGLQ